jgi:hypothetical protein
LPILSSSAFIYVLHGLTHSGVELRSRLSRGCDKGRQPRIAKLSLNWLYVSTWVGHIPALLQGSPDGSDQPPAEFSLVDWGSFPKPYLSKSCCV